MIKTLIYLGIILIGLCLSPYIVGNTGYLYLSAWGYEIETSLVFAIVALVIAYGVIVIAEWIAIKSISLVLGSRYLPERWRRNAAKRHTLNGALALAEENWPDAERCMAKGAAKGELPALNLLAAARAAQHQGKYAERDDYLEKAVTEPNAATAVFTTRTRYLLKQGQLERARTALNHLAPTSKSSAAVVKLAMEVYLAQQDWRALRELLPAIKKHALLNDASFEDLSVRVSVNLLEQAGSKDWDSLDKEWQWLSRSEKQLSANRAAYALGLAKQGKKAEAVKLLLKDLESLPESHILTLLPQILNGQDELPRQQLLKLAPRYEDVHEYHECVARLCQQAREFKTANEHWRRACELNPSKENWLALAELDEQLGNTELALQHYRKAAKA
ncbi:heme biosynthesis HemY N-terminal domain-containing protein [Shewanella zhangzhouensis]|uniref:heme biosynthesis HemY N-terminal domain-containing protein n=1 Tax=Shewanella zhangzhouensis TaxID=2864213 RepID=UPI001C65E787|nr:heme biosynthesis HemY N-terminal domain-containing protein [Shewanella zhangzhouensis]QYK04882.1 heme biosynthesis protein HemY [Shewanella zhangzhouensis]